MSKLNDLITQLCPDGVQYKKLGEIAVIKKGTQLNKSMLLDDGKYPVLNGGKDYSGYWNKYNFDGDRIAISQGGASAGFVTWMKKPFWAGAHCYVIDSSKESELRYLFHVVKSHELDYMKAQYGAGIPSLSLKTLSQTEIPLPPLPVQEEIARILDSFTELEAELEAELSDRKKQYEYYRNHLLDKKNLERMDGKPVEMKRLNEISISIKAGGDVPDDTVKGQATPTDTHPYPVFSNGTNDKALYGYCSKYSVEKESVTISARGSIGFHSVRKPYFTPIIRLITVTPDIKRITASYLDLALTQTSINGDKGGIPQLTVPKVKGIEVPVPSLATQERVVDILDRFDTLTTSLTDGIPAEIAMRREQYEYYRSRLLDFPHLPDGSASVSDSE